MSELTPEEKRKIYEEEKERVRAQKKIKRKTKPATWGCLILIILVIIVAVISERSSKTTLVQEKKLEGEKFSKIAQKIEAISDNESVAKYVSISKIEDNGSVYRITINLLFEPENYRQVQTWTDAVCESSKRILDNNGIVRNISVWANRTIRNGKVIVYGRTFYSRHIKRFEFKNAEELNL